MEIIKEMRANVAYIALRGASITVQVPCHTSNEFDFNFLRKKAPFVERHTMEYFKNTFYNTLATGNETMHDSQLSAQAQTGGVVDDNERHSDFTEQSVSDIILKSSDCSIDSEHLLNLDVLKLDSEIPNENPIDNENNFNELEELLENENIANANSGSMVGVPEHNIKGECTFPKEEMTATPLLPGRYMNPTNMNTNIEYFINVDTYENYDLENIKYIDEISSNCKEYCTETMIEVEDNTYESKSPKSVSTMFQENREMFNDSRYKVNKECKVTDQSKTLDYDVEIQLINNEVKLTNIQTDESAVNRFHQTFQDSLHDLYKEDHEILSNGMNKVTHNQIVIDNNYDNSKNYTSLETPVYASLNTSTKQMLDKIKTDEPTTSYQHNFYSWINTQSYNFKAMSLSSYDTRETDKIGVISISSEEAKDDLNHIQDEEESNCSGYHSSDFEFISEDEAKLDGLVTNFRKKDVGYPVPVKKSHCPEVDTIEISRDNKIGSANGDGINLHENGYNGNNNYKPQNAGHVIREGNEYYHLFSGLYNPTLITNWENKTIYTSGSNPMLIEFDGVGFDNNLIRINRNQRVSKDLKKEAMDSKKRILELYPEENKRLRRF